LFSKPTAAGDWKKLFKGSGTPHRPSVPTISEESNSSMTGNRIDNLQDIASFEGGSRELPSYKSSSQQTPTSSQIHRSIEVNRNSLVSVVKDT